jgi:hypothetical protein
MTTDFESQHPRSAAGKFGVKVHGTFELTLSPELTRVYDLDALEAAEQAELFNHLDSIVDTDPDLSYGELYRRPDIDGVYHVVNEKSDGLSWVVANGDKLVPVPDVVVKSIDLPQFTTTRAIQFERAAITNARYVELTAQRPVDRDAANTAWTEYLEALVGIAAARVIEASDRSQYRFNLVRLAKDKPTELEAAEAAYSTANAYALEANRALLTARVDLDRWKQTLES